MSASPAPSSDSTVYLVLEDFGKFGRAYRETSEDGADLESVIENMLTGQFDKPLRVVAFNTAEGWSRDVTGEIAREVARRSKWVAA
jgi:hypothetical protein